MIMEWWTELPLGTQLLIKDAGLCLFACFLALCFGSLAWSLLRNHHIDRLVLPPKKEPGAPGAAGTAGKHKKEPPALPSIIICGLVMATSLILPTSAFATYPRLLQAASGLVPFVVGAWTFLIALGGAMILGKWFAQSCLDLLESPGIRDKIEDALFAPEEVDEAAHGALPDKPDRVEPVVLFASKLVYFTAVLVGLIGAMEIVELAETSELLRGGFSGAVRFFAWIAMIIAIVVVFYKMSGSSKQPQTEGEQKEAAGAKSPLSPRAVVAVLLIAALFLFGIKFFVLLLLAAVAAIAFSGSLRRRLPDLWAGFYLHCVAEKTFTFEEYGVRRLDIGLLDTDLRATGKKPKSIPNRDLLTRFVKAAPSAPTPADSTKEPTSDTPSTSDTSSSDNVSTRPANVSPAPPERGTGPHTTRDIPSR